MYPETLTGRCHQSPCEHQFYHVSAVGCNIRRDLKRLIFKKICQIRGCCCPGAALEGPPAARPSPQYYLLLLLTLTAFLTNPYKSLQPSPHYFLLLLLLTANNILTNPQYPVYPCIMQAYHVFATLPCIVLISQILSTPQSHAIWICPQAVLQFYECRLFINKSCQLQFCITYQFAQTIEV